MFPLQKEMGFDSIAESSLVVVALTKEVLVFPSVALKLVLEAE